MKNPTSFKPNQEIAVEGHLYAYKWDYSREFHICWSAEKPVPGPTSVYIGPYTLRHTLPADFNEIQCRLQGLEAARTALYKAFRAEDEQIAEAKEKLLSLTYTPEQADPTLTIEGA